MSNNLVTKIIRNFLWNKGSFYDRIFYVFRDSGILMFKLGQILSTRFDILPQKLCDQLSNLLDCAPLMDNGVIDSVIMNDFGKKPTEVFKTFDYAAIGSASISQVHKATLMNGSIVAVKIKRPNIDATLKSDIKQLNKMIAVLSFISPLVRYLRRQNVIDQMASWITQEVDFENEKKNIEKVHSEYAHLSDKQIKGAGKPTFIRVFPEYCTKNILVTEFVEGVTVSQWIRSGRSDKYNGYATIKTYLRCAINGLFNKNEYYFQADPHPGNIILQGGADGANIDCGLVLKLNKKEADVIKSYLMGLYLKDKNKVIQTIRRSSNGLSQKKICRLSSDIESYMELLDYEGLGYWFMGIIKIFIKHRIDVPEYLVAFGRCMVIIEGTLSMIQPGTKVLDVLEDELQQAAINNMDELYSRRNMIRALNNIARNVMTGEISIGMH